MPHDPVPAVALLDAAAVGPWGRLPAGTASMVVISAIEPGDLFRGEAWPWAAVAAGQHNGDSAANGSPST